MENEPKFEVTQNQRFRQLVEDLVDKSETLSVWVNPTNSDDKMTVIEAIEKNDVSTYTGQYAGDKKLDAIHCLTSIYDELGKDKPDEEFIEETVKTLKQYL